VKLLDRLRRAPREAADIAVVGTGLPALAVASALAARRRRVVLLGPADDEGPPGVGLAVLGPSRPYDRVVRERGHDEARALWTAGRENLAALVSLLPDAGRDRALTARGSFLLAADRTEAESLAESEDMLRDDGFSGEFLDHYMLESRFDVSGFAGAYWAAEGAEIDLAAVRGVLVDAARSAGVAFAPAPVRSIAVDRRGVTVETEAGEVRAGAGVVATEAATGALVPDVGGLLQPAASARIRFTPEAGAALPTAARSADGTNCWVATPDGLTVAATGLADPGDVARLDALAARLHALPGTARRWDEPGEVTVDGLPVVGLVRGGPLAVACGFGALAASFAFVAARWVAEALVSGRDPTPEPLRPREADAGTAV